MLRNEINANHPVFGDGYRKLEDHETIEQGDQTACVSCLLSPEGDTWVEIPEIVGMTVLDSLADDADAEERVFRRKEGVH